MLDEDKDSQFSKLTPESIVINYIFDMENGDFGILDEVKSAIHQQIALELVRVGQGKLLAGNLDKFKDLDKRQIVETILESGDDFLAKQIAGQTSDVEFEDLGKIIDKI
ncbi:MAG: hypothetical protein A2406_00775 [Candidatus Komeilibacteria bacterium RIFOXYC1_FULL_37_11]|uniref:Uncharacterized protein n=1 Tax=Candidatus Komeilibacteria bacterium RIFOXYC1_FULL_37_11 TaxID=1798555 RepID=A0A1G2BWP9_9BACT|nr:MAG: hypothetical protein A2406_00775 [Candidatus Komeilibacteria bacterium RIFOXYC1_FULL_37_11]OGY95277.1 MAG: hypothetical protein A2611_01080 [Candidatus Komeilibacteria bacterium RIFOXYD1_FULL_37_29]